MMIMIRPKVIKNPMTKNFPTLELVLIPLKSILMGIDVSICTEGVTVWATDVEFPASIAGAIVSKLAYQFSRNCRQVEVKMFCLAGINGNLSAMAALLLRCWKLRNIGPVAPEVGGVAVHLTD